MKEIKYFVKGVIKGVAFAIGFILCGLPMIPMLIWVVGMAIGGYDKAVDEYTWTVKWFSFWSSLGDQLNKW